MAHTEYLAMGQDLVSWLPSDPGGASGWTWGSPADLNSRNSLAWSYGAGSSKRVHNKFGLLGIKGMVHLIHKLHLKHAFLCIKCNDTINFGHKYSF